MIYIYICIYIYILSLSLSVCRGLRLRFSQRLRGADGAKPTDLLGVNVPNVASYITQWRLTPDLPKKAVTLESIARGF